MTWQVALIFLIITGSAGEILTKLVTNRLPDRQTARGVFWQYLICALLVAAFAIKSGDVVVNGAFAAVCAIGVVNAFGNYFMWRAMAASLAKTALFLPMIGVVPIILAVVILNEIALWNVTLTIGIAACFIAAWLFSTRSRDKDDARDSKWLVWVVGMILAQGVASFSVKWFSTEITLSSFLLAWYSFSFVGSIILLFIERATPFKLGPLNLAAIFGVSLSIVVALALLNRTYEMGGPVSIIQSVYGLTTTMLAILAGLLFFKEAKTLTRRDGVGFVLGLLGVVLVLLR